MAGTFIDMVNRIATELRRSNAAADIKQAINDAISEASLTRFTFDELTKTFDTVAGQEYYPDQGMGSLDAAWYLIGSTRYDLSVVSQLVLDTLAQGNPVGGQLEYVSRYGGNLRLYPIPNSIVTVNIQGVSAVSPSPLVNDADTNAWLTNAELYIRALAKRNFLRDIVRDYGEARVYDAIADEYKQILVERQAVKESTGVIRSTQF